MSFKMSIKNGTFNAYQNNRVQEILYLYKTITTLYRVFDHF